MPKRDPERLGKGQARSGWLVLGRRLPWLPMLVTAAVLVTGGFPVDPVRDAATLADLTNASLQRSLSYVVIAPLSNVLDMLTLMSVSQHVSFVMGLLVMLAAWRVAVWWLRRPRWRSHAIAFGLLLAAVLLTYIAAVVLPRPMAGLVTNNINLLRVDFHSHTSASHDGRPGWSVESNRAWHSAAGFDVAMITDHASVVEAERGVAVNPNPVGEGTVVLQSIEVTWTGEHVSIPGAQRTYRGLLTENMRDVDPQSLTLASFVRGREPIVVWHHPHDLDTLPIAEGPGTGGVRAIEIINGSPADMDEIRSERADIVAIASERGLALTSGSDNHGWGYATPGWTLMHIPGWQTLDHDELATEIATAIRTSGFRSTIVVERRMADPTGSRLSLVVTVFGAPLRMLTTISVDERVAWLAWTWVAFAAAVWMRRSREAGRGGEPRTA